MKQSIYLRILRVALYVGAVLYIVNGNKENDIYEMLCGITILIASLLDDILTVQRRTMEKINSIQACVFVSNQKNIKQFLKTNMEDIINEMFEPQPVADKNENKETPHRGRPRKNK